MADAPAIPVQWLIDCLQEMSKQGPITQIGYLLLVIAAVGLAVAGVKCAFRRGFQDIDDENRKLTARVATNKAALDKIRRENAALKKDIDSLQARVPSDVLAVVDWEIREGNYAIAIRKLQGMFDDLAPGLAGCCARLSDLTSGRSADGGDPGTGDDLARFRRLADLLRAGSEEAPPS